ncbi:MAG: beta-glucosidase [Frankiales bacterium]|nr:beta-glucosidase [Frankiales bacterium]
MTGLFPEGFRWGAATAAYQIEGAVAAGGRTPSIWDTFSHTPGAILGGDTGDVACDHYHRYREDVALMAKLGLADYRFSISWTRVLPVDGRSVNQAGLDFYSELVDELLGHGVRPLITLYHWDLPQYLQDRGGWTNRETAQRFADFASIIAERLGDRVPSFTTLNEPWCSAFLGHASGEHAPGLRDNAAAFTAAHHLLLAHGLGVQALRAGLPAGRDVSITLNPAVIRPASAAQQDQEAAELADLVGNRVFLDPLFHARLSPELVAATASVTDWAFVREGDLGLISSPIDFLGVNYYTPAIVGRAPVEQGNPWPGIDGVFAHPHTDPQTAMGWQVEPEGLTNLLIALSHERPGLPMVVTENGSAYPDTVDAHGQIFDGERSCYLRAHVDAVAAAIQAGVDVRGYLVWSLLDNFEWAWGYSQRFGIIHVDFATQERRLKESGKAYAQIIAAHGLGSDTPDSSC